MTDVVRFHWFKWDWLLCCSNKREKNREKDGEWMEPIPRPSQVEGDQISKKATNNNGGNSEDKKCLGETSSQGAFPRTMSWAQAMDKVVDLDLKELDTSERDDELMRSLPKNLTCFRRGSAGDIDMGSDSDDDCSVHEKARRRKSEMKIII